MKRISRRQFLKAGAAASAAGVLSVCASAPAACAAGPEEENCLKNLTGPAPGSDDASLEIEAPVMTAGTRRDIVLRYTLPVTMEERAELFGTLTLTMPRGIRLNENDLIDVAGRGAIPLTQTALEQSADGAYRYSGVDYGFAKLSISGDGRVLTYADADFRPNNGVDVTLFLRDKTVPVGKSVFTAQFAAENLLLSASTTLKAVCSITDLHRVLTRESYEDFTKLTLAYTGKEQGLAVLMMREGDGKWVRAEHNALTVSDLKANTHYEFKLIHPAGSSNVVSYYSGAFFVDDFGAVGNGVTDDAPAINAAIEAAAAQGGGLVVFTANTVYAANSIHLRSNVHLYLDDHSTLVALDGIDEIEPMNAPFSDGQDFGHSHFRSALLWAERQENIRVICNNATINGNGNLDTGTIETVGHGDKTFSFKQCQNIEVSGASEEAPLTFLSYGHFAFIATGCDNVKVSNIYVGDLDGQRDVVNFMQCNNTSATNVKVLKCSNDIIKLGSDYSLGFVRDVKGTYVDNIYANYIGGGNVFQLGSETFGDFSDLTIRNVTITDNANKAGLGFCVNDGGSVYNVSIENVDFANCSGGITLMASDRSSRVPEPMAKAGTIDRVTIKNATLKHNQGESGAIPVILSGFKAHRSVSDMVEGKVYPITNITLDNVSIEASGSYEQTLEHADSEIQNVGKGGCYRPSSYPNAKGLPAYALLATKVSGLTVQGGALTYEPTQNNNRYALVLDQAKDVKVSNMSMMLGQAVGDVIDVRGESSYAFENITEIPFTADAEPRILFSAAAETTGRVSYPCKDTGTLNALYPTRLADAIVAIDNTGRSITVTKQPLTAKSLAGMVTSLDGRILCVVKNSRGVVKAEDAAVNAGDVLAVTAENGVETAYRILKK